MTYSSKKYKKKLLVAILLTIGSGSTSYAATIVTNENINQLIFEAIKTHPLVGSAQAEREATVEGINAAKLNMLPTPSFTTSYNNDDNFVSELGIRQPLWAGGRLTANVNQAIFDDKAATENIYIQQNQVAKTTIEAWQTYINAIAQQEIYLASLSQLNEFEARMQRRVNAGKSARIELDLATNRILQETNSYNAAIEQQRIAEARLEQLTGRPIPQRNDRNVDSLDELVDHAKRESVGFETMAFNNASFYNPSVIREFFQIESAKQEVKAQSANKFPTIYAEYKHTYDHDTKEDDGRFYLGLNYQPGAGFSNLALTRASEARVNSLIMNQEAAQRSVMESIQVEYQQFASAKSREESYVAAVAGAQMVLASYNRQFIAGRKSWLEVLNAVRELTEYQIKLVQTRTDLLGSFYKLQVDFSVMPWQGAFNTNRQNVRYYRATDSINEWVDKTKPKSNRNNLGYRQNGVFDSNKNDEYINRGIDGQLPDEVYLPDYTKRQLDQGEYVLVDDNYKPIPQSEEQILLSPFIKTPSYVELDTIEPYLDLPPQDMLKDIENDVVELNEVIPQEVQPTRVKPQEVEPTRVKPQEVEPARVKPQEVEPVSVEPNEVEPTRVEPNKVETTRVEPTKIEAIKAVPIKVIAYTDDTNLVDLDKVGSIRVEPIKVEPYETKDDSLTTGVNYKDKFDPVNFVFDETTVNDSETVLLSVSASKPNSI